MAGKSFKKKAVARLGVILLTALFTVSPLAGFVADATGVEAGAMTVYAAEVSNFRASDNAVAHKLANPGVIRDVDSLSYDTGVKFSLDGKEVTLTNPDGGAAYAILNNGRTFVPLRAIADLLGGSTNWDSQAQIASVEASNGQTIETYDGASSVVVNGNTVQNISDGQRVFVKDGRTYLPVRTAIESVGFTVNWNSTTRTVEIKSPGYTPEYNPEYAPPESKEGQPVPNRPGWTYDSAGIPRDPDGYDPNGFKGGYNREGKHWTEINRENITDEQRAEWRSEFNPSP